MDYFMANGGSIQGLTFNKKNFELFQGDFHDYRHYGVVHDNGEVAALVCFVENSFSYGSGYVGLAYVEVSKAYKGMGLSKLLLKKLFRLARRLQKGVYVSGYLEEGFTRLKPTVTELKYAMDLDVIEG